MKAIVKVSRLSTGGNDYLHGDIADLSDEEMVQLAPFVERVVPTVAVVDERDAKIAELERTIESLRSEIATKSAGSSKPDVAPPTRSNSTRRRQKVT